MGWEVVRVFKDEGRSGYTGEIRPGFEDMIKLLGKGQADTGGSSRWEHIFFAGSEFPFGGPCVAAALASSL